MQYGLEKGETLLKTAEKIGEKKCLTLHLLEALGFSD